MKDEAGAGAMAFGRAQADWDILTEAGEEFLIERARLGKLTSYTELNATLERRTGIRRFDFELQAERAEMGHLLGLMPDEDDLSYARWSTAIRQEIAALDDGAVVAGHSVGATILLHALAEQPPEKGLGAGFDIVLHGEAVVMRDLPLLQQVAGAFLAKYGQDWAFDVAGDGTFRGHGVSLVYQLTPVHGLGFGKGPFSHTRWDFTT